ncbi:MAG: MFS transporter [Acidobacteria bacterium]|nr:MAG: MFS transporter [Acidobacteriota bacterium]
MAGLLSRERIIAGPAFNRWLVPPAALLIHLCIGQAYAISVFNLPLSRAIGITESRPEDWKLTTLGWIYTLAIVFLGLSAAFAGTWLERAGPRKVGVVAASCWGGGFLIAALGVFLHRIGLVYLGYGVIGGCGLGLGYVSPVSTLIKWFPDRRGMATGMAIMGFGGGALIAAPLSDALMTRFRSATSVGVWQTFVVLGLAYFGSMLAGAFLFRLPPPGWRPPGRSQPGNDRAVVARGHVHVDTAVRTAQFPLLWAVLCLNVTAGICVLGQASPMIQEVFKGAVSPSAAAGFVGLLSLFNIGGRIAWASLSDYLGRKRTYAVFFFLGAVLYACVPLAGRTGSVPLFVACVCVILTMYGGGFATIPAYLADVFGTQFVGAIHGRLLTAWSMAGVLGPVLVNYLRQYQIDRGVAKADAYNLTMEIMACVLVAGFLCNLAIRRVPDRHYMTAEELAAEQRRLRQSAPAPPAEAETDGNDGSGGAPARGRRLAVALAWGAVGAPLAWGIASTLGKALLLFKRD